MFLCGRVVGFATGLGWAVRRPDWVWVEWLCFGFSSEVVCSEGVGV